MALLLLASALFAAGLVSLCQPIARHVLPETASRIAGLDGLRGILAFSVFAHHSVAIRQTARTGLWADPPGNVANLMGQLAVAFFFMISAYLFVGKIFRSHGKLDVRAFAIGRFFRLVPVYLLMTTAALLIVTALSGFRFDTPLWRQLAGNLGWLGFGFFGRHDLNGVALSHVIISPVWSIRYEWILYFLLPFLALLLRWGLNAWLVVLGFLLLGLFDSWFAYFGLGAIAYRAVASRVAGPRWSWVAALAALVATGLFFHDAVAPPVMVLSLVTFVICLTNGPIIALLDSRPLVFAGQISYSVYLLHMPVLFAMTYGIFGPDAIAGWSDLRFFGAFALAGMGVLAVATVSYVLVEKPGMDAARLFRPRKGPVEGAEALAAP